MITLDISRPALVILDIWIWGVLSVGSGFLFHRRPVSSFDHDSWLTRLRPFERDGRVYERRLRILRWKDQLPEAGALFAGGFSKRSALSRSTGYLERFVVETRRAEVTHWALLACGPLFFVWNPWYAGVLMLVYAVVANVPFILIQRYNRARLLRILASRAARQPA